MSKGKDHREVLAALQVLLRSGRLSADAHDEGTGVLAAIASKTRLLIAGPESAVRDALANAICARAMPDIELFVADTPAGFDPNGADICIWCTAVFSAAEVQVWQPLPDRLKRLSFLVPVADVTTLPERLSEGQLADLKIIAAKEFHGLFPIVLGAERGSQNAELSSILLREIESMVCALRLASYEEAQKFLASSDDEVPMPEAEPNTVAETGQGSDEVATQNAAQQALSILAEYTSDLAPEIVDDDPEVLGYILTNCVAAADALAEAMQAHLDAVASHELILLSEDARTAADHILLLSVEGGLTQTICAVTTLLQLRRELEVLNAA